MYQQHPRYDPLNPGQLEEIDMQIDSLQHERQRLIEQASVKPLEPTEAVMVTLAHEAGELKGLLRSETGRRERLQKHLEAAREQADRVPALESSRDAWKDRAIRAENKIERSERAKRAIRKKKGKK